MDNVIISLNCFSICVRGGMSMELADVEGDALLRHAPVRRRHQLDQRVQRDLQPGHILHHRR